MVVGLITWEIYVAGCESLKDKRRVIKSLKDRLHNRFNVSVSETGHQKVWQRAQLACCVVSPDRKHAQLVITSVDGFVCDEALARVIDSKTEFL